MVSKTHTSHCSIILFKVFDICCYTKLCAKISEQRLLAQSCKNVKKIVPLNKLSNNYAMKLAIIDNYEKINIKKLKAHYSCKFVFYMSFYLHYNCTAFATSIK